MKTALKSANYRYLEFISSFDDHSGGQENLTKVTDSIVDKGRSYRGLNFFSERNLQVLEAIGRGEYMTFGMQGMDIRQHLENIRPSVMSRIFKRLRLHGIIERDLVEMIIHFRPGSTILHSLQAVRSL